MTRTAGLGGVHRNAPPTGWVNDRPSLPPMSNHSAIDPHSFDASVEPGDDFYRYVNGGWQQANPVPPEYGAWTAAHEVHVRNETLLHELLEAAAAGSHEPGSPERMVGDYYASGMDVDQIEAAGLGPIQHFLDSAAGVATVADLRALAVAARLEGIRLFMGGYVSPDFEDSSRYLLYLTQGGLGLPERDYYFNEDDRSVEIREAYVAHVTTMLGLIGSADPAGEAAAIMDVETELASASLTATESRDVDRTTNKRTLAQLDELMPGYDLPAFLGGIGAEVEAVNLNHPDFFAALDRLLTDVPIETWRAYARWHIIRSAASSLPARFEDEAFAFYGQMLGGQREQKERWKRVLAAASADIGEQVSQLFVAAAFPPEAKERCDRMVGHLVLAMESSIRALDWMGEDTKDKALEKLAGFSTKIGYPDQWRDYSGLEVDRGPYVANRMAAASFEFRRKLSKIGGPVESEWEMPPHVVNAYYHPLHNEIVFPAGILQPPFFNAEADDAVNYGGIGSVIGHEITHGFDDQGSKFDPDGNLRNWWTDADRTEFDGRAEKLVAQFDTFVVLEGLTVNGRLTLGENIADLGGVAVSFDALRLALGDRDLELIDGFTPEQRFFLSYATAWRSNYTDEYLRLITTTDPHSPGHHRVNGPLANFAPFHEAFGIEQGDEMFLDKDDIVEIW